jgi:hypothetical protein
LSSDVPYIETPELQRRAEDLRIVHLGPDYDVPVDVELLVEKLDIEIWPMENMRATAGIESAIVHPLRVIIVDEDLYNSTQEWNRLRSSLAHEVAHFILHQDYFTGAQFSTVDEWISFVQDQEHHKRMEIHSHEFGGRLLVPKDKLVEVIQTERAKKPNVIEFQNTIVGRLSNHFWVSPDLIEVRLDRENCRYLITRV